MFDDIPSNDVFQQISSPDIQRSDDHNSNTNLIQ
jgi:hypothetical protein